MGSGTRQWKALMRKNFINWKRQPKCSFIEICCPAACMFLMVIFRNLVTPETVSVDQLLKVRAPLYPALSWVSSTTPTDENYGEWTYSQFGE